MICAKDNLAPGILGWELAVPLPGRALFGLSNYNHTSAQTGFTPGWCTMHVVQYQHNEFGVGAQYDFDVVIFDGAKKQIGWCRSNPRTPKPIHW